MFSLNAPTPHMRKIKMDKPYALNLYKGHDLESRLFFSSRNLAIEAMLLRLETNLLRQGFDAQCFWNESSFQSPTVMVRMMNPNKKANWEYGQCTAWVSRETIASPSHLSSCFYVLKDFSKYEEDRRESKLLLSFRDAVERLYLSGHLATEIAKVNYPFEYPFLSSF